MTVHIATSAELGRSVRRGLREGVAFVADNWLVGPCASDPEGHAPARCDYWDLRGRERARWLESFRELTDALDSSGRVVVWASRMWSDTVSLWAVCAWRLLRRPGQPDIDLAVVGASDDAEVGAERWGGSIDVTASAARKALEHARPLSVTRVRQMAVFWRKLSGRSPLLSGKGDRAARGREDVVVLGDYQAGFFPRSAARGLLLSRFDELLFSCLAEKGSTPVEVFVSRAPAGEELRRWLGATGDVFLATRLAQWAAHGGAGAALVSEPVQPENIMKAARYRLSKAGGAVLRRGLGEIAEGAPLPVWGVTAYDPRAPWVVVNDEDGRRRLERLGASP